MILLSHYNKPVSKYTVLKHTAPLNIRWRDSKFSFKDDIFQIFNILDLLKKIPRLTSAKSVIFRMLILFAECACKSRTKLFCKAS